jgi:hypothetical protein
MSSDDFMVVKGLPSRLDGTRKSWLSACTHRGKKMIWLGGATKNNNVSIFSNKKKDHCIRNKQTHYKKGRKIGLGTGLQFKKPCGQLQVKALDPSLVKPDAGFPWRHL